MKNCPTCGDDDQINSIIEKSVEIKAILDLLPKPFLDKLKSDLDRISRLQKAVEAVEVLINKFKVSYDGQSIFCSICGNNWYGEHKKTCSVRKPLQAIKEARE